MLNRTFLTASALAIRGRLSKDQSVPSLTATLPRRLTAFTAATWISLLVLSSLCLSQVSVVTQHNDTKRTGQNLSETILNTSNVNVNAFGKLFSRSVDGQIYAQPLYLPGLSVAGKTRNVVYVATQHNSVYAFDADDPAQSAPLWQVNLGTSVPSNDICTISGDTDPSDCPYLDINPEIGITSTPAIDPNTGIIYVVAKSKQTSDTTYHFFLHALDVKSGAERLGGPMEITGQVSGGGAGSGGGVVVFDPVFHLQRPGLLLLNGVVYIAFGSVGDIGAYHGWIMAYDATALQQTAILSVTPDGCCGGIWQAGAGLVADADNNIYLMTGDGNFDANASGRDYGDSFLKISTSGGLAITDYFTPSNQGTLFADNIDLGSGGPLLMPGTNLLVGIGKDKLLRLVDTGDLGQFNAALDNVVQEFTASPRPYFGSPVYWNSPNNGPVVYLWPASDVVSAYKFVSGQLQTTPVTQSTVQNSTGFSNSAALTLSANSNLLGSGILWTSASFSGSATGPSVPGIMRAFDATDLSNELWDSKQNAARDDVGLYGKFSPPMIANGKVYLATFSNQLAVYGLLADFNLSAAPASATVVAGQSATSTITVAPVSGFSSAVTLTCASVSLPTGASCSFSSPSVTAGGTPATSTLTITTSATTPAGTFTVTVTGTSGSLSHNTSISLTVNPVPPPADFTLTASALSPASVAAGGSATSGVTIAPLNGFNGALNLTCSSITPVVTPAPTCSFVPNSIANGSGTSTLTLGTSATTPTDAYTITVAASGSVSHSTTVNLTVTAAPVSDFTLAVAAPSPAPVAAGGSATSMITITPANGFNSLVTLACSIAPVVSRPPTCSFNPAAVANGSGTSTLSISTIAATTASIPAQSRGILFAMWLPVGGLALLGTGIVPRRRKLLGLLLLCLMLSGLIFLLACGGGSSTGGNGGGGHAGTPTGTYTVTVAATSGSLSHTATATVTVP